MKKIILAIMGATMGVSAFAATGAQDLNLRVGLFQPSKGSVRDSTSDNWLSLGLDYKLRDLDFGGDSMVKYRLGLSIDWIERNDFRAIPVLATATGSNGQGIYWLAGAGFAFNRYPATGGSENETRFAYTIGLGYEFKGSQLPLSLELRYQGNNRSELQGWALYAGFRF